MSRRVQVVHFAGNPTRHRVHFVHFINFAATLHRRRVQVVHFGFPSRPEPHEQFVQDSAEFRSAFNKEADPKRALRMLREFYAPWLTKAAA